MISFNVPYFVLRALNIFRARKIVQSILNFLIVVNLATLAQSGRSANQPIPAFPGAEGFGATAIGGNGGKIFHVTNLDDSGSGTFRDAASQPHRTIIFDVGGIIHLKSNVNCASDLTILGQTAPANGIALYGHSVSFSGSTNIIVRYLRIREGIGGDRGKCSINLAHGGNMIFDHLSVEWGRWDCLDLTEGSHDITFQNCIFGQSIDPQRFGALVDSVTNITLSHNLWIDNKSRNPKAKGTIQYINNIVYNWGIDGLVGGHSERNHQLDVIGNYFIKGPSSNNRFAGMFTATDHVFQIDNYADLDCDGRLDGKLISETNFMDGGGSPVFVRSPFLHPQIPVTVDLATNAWLKVVESAGCSLHRDLVDLRILNELKSLGKDGQILHSEAESDAEQIGKKNF